MLPKTDIWRIGLLQRPTADIFADGSIAGLVPTWMPAGRPFTYLADPFAIRRDDRLYLFAETYDYRTRIGGIDVLTLDNDFNMLDHRPCLRQPWHLSYPFLIESGGETYMLPEAHKSGDLLLYRATRFPFGWEAVASIPLDSPAIDPSPIFFEGYWWMFYAPSTDLAARMGVMHVAFAEHLTGPWRPHPLNPLRRDMAGARPGGTPVVVDGKLIVPLQDCSQTYGGAVKLLKIERLTPSAFEADICATISAPASFAPYIEGLHTLSHCGDLTFFDAKRISRSPRKWAINVARAPILARKVLRKSRFYTKE
ncbi:MAG: formyl transferase [Rhizorhabdus sp.]|nr:formyl transferase [Rhizorhabdus sp.]